MLDKVLVVVFGAGAPYDSASALRPDQRSATWRPPLANQLFDLGRFGGYISQFPKGPSTNHLSTIARSQCRTGSRKISDRREWKSGATAPTRGHSVLSTDQPCGTRGRLQWGD